MFICKSNTKNIVTIKIILRCFELALGLKVNLAKSSIEGVGVDQVSLERFAVMLNCEIMSFTFVDLGVPIGGNHKRVSFWKGLLDKLKKKLSRWKGRLMSIARNVTLIKSALSSMFIFILSILKVFKYVNNEMIKNQQQFLWGHEATRKKKTVWIKWEIIFNSWLCGGLGIKDILSFN